MVKRTMERNKRQQDSSVPWMATVVGVSSCLNYGAVPEKPLLHAQEQYTERSEGSTSGWEAVTVPGQSHSGGWSLAAGSKWAG